MIPPKPGPVIYLFAKAPRDGLVKTRMQPALSRPMCTDLAVQMLRQVSHTLSRHWHGPRVICAWPDAKHDVFVQLKREYGYELDIQQGRDLGERMHYALLQGIAREGAAAVVGADVPQIGGEIFRQVETWLGQGKEVVGPSEDGGFYLLGLHTADPGLFQHIRWKEESVLSQVLERCRFRGRRFHRLPTLRDIDQVGDLQWLAKRDRRYLRFLTGARISYHD